MCQMIRLTAASDTTEHLGLRWQREIKCRFEISNGMVSCSFERCVKPARVRARVWCLGSHSCLKEVRAVKCVCVFAP